MWATMQKLRMRDWDMAENSRKQAGADGSRREQAGAGGSCGSCYCSAVPTSASAPARSRPLPPAPARSSLADAGMLLVCLIWGANFSVMKGAFVYVPPLAFTAVRFTVASLLLYLLLRWRNGTVAMPAGLGWRMVWLGVLGNTAYQVAFTLSLLWGTATNTALIISTIPAMVTVLAGVRRIEPVTPRMWAGT